MGKTVVTSPDRFFYFFAFVHGFFLGGGRGRLGSRHSIRVYNDGFSDLASGCLDLGVVLRLLLLFSEFREPSCGAGRRRREFPRDCFRRREKRHWKDWRWFCVRHIGLVASGEMWLWDMQLGSGFSAQFGNVWIFFTWFLRCNLCFSKYGTEKFSRVSRWIFFFLMVCCVGLYQAMAIFDLFSRSETIFAACFYRQILSFIFFLMRISDSKWYSWFLNAVFLPLLFLWVLLLIWHVWNSWIRNIFSFLQKTVWMFILLWFFNLIRNAY